MTADPPLDSPADLTPVALVHGWGGSFATTWQQSGFTMLLADAGRPVIGIDLLGHGTAPKPHDPEAYIDLTDRVFDALPDTPVDAVGFSLGALTLLRAALAQPDRFRRLVLAGIGRNVFEHDPAASARIIDAIHAQGETDDNHARLFAQYAYQRGNDPIALAAVLQASGLRQPSHHITEDALAKLDLPVLIVVGENDFVRPVDRLANAIPGAQVETVRHTDHFATPESFGFIDAALSFLDAVPC